MKRVCILILALWSTFVTRELFLLKKKVTLLIENSNIQNEIKELIKERNTDE